MIASMWLLNGFTDPALFRDADISRLFAIFQLIFLGFVVSYEILMKSSSQIYLTQTEMNKIHDR